MNVFAPFTNDEVESIRSIVLLGQQQNDMLLSNCSNRPILQTRSFIRRFKRLLLDSQTSISDITSTANEQYVAIIAGMRVKKNSRNSLMVNTTSVSNLALSLYQSVESVPFKFRVKYGKVEPDTSASALPPPLPTRSRSVSEGLVLLDPGQPSQYPSRQPTPVPSSNTFNDLSQNEKMKYPILPPLTKTFPRACKNVSELPPGTLAALLSNNGGPAIICRVLAHRNIQNVNYLLVSFFQSDISPSYVQPHHLVKLPPYMRTNKLILPDPLTVDELLERMMQTAQVIIMDNEIQPIELQTAANTQTANSQVTNFQNNVHDGSQVSWQVAIQQHRDLMFRTLACAAHLVFLDFAANYIVPPDKLKLMLEAIGMMNPVKYNSSKETNNHCMQLIYQILRSLD
ncbi:hypothetical protein TRFO_37418 [Tritrichomonas foetus]|uniref:Uncharacterized protein n=1 Tax=Tritrichomonas foetus TaxID=1144522 RepID=A0A1J4JB66_9EUKA|nr:hypothetical protein TRFO_37418 [Tritrichomonas foetus]|eukprot:OHS96434.1 hypothetical protein TRFO_37418 [Tritrichomonas foetus]